jgi:sialidase-1
LPSVSENGHPAQAVESQLVELPGGRITMNSRARGRYVATSDDGGSTWSQLFRERQLEGPDTAAGLLRYSGLGDGDKSRILFSYPSRPNRERGVIYLSYDDGATWPISKVLRPDRFSYSCLARLADGRIACVFDGTPATNEFRTQGDKFSVILAIFTLDWLTAGSDSSD